jgi:hypothetical protein
VSGVDRVKPVSSLHEFLDNWHLEKATDGLGMLRLPLVRHRFLDRVSYRTTGVGLLNAPASSFGDDP